MCKDYSADIYLLGMPLPHWQALYLFTGLVKEEKKFQLGKWHAQQKYTITEMRIVYVKDATMFLSHTIPLILKLDYYALFYKVTILGWFP